MRPSLRSAARVTLVPVALAAAPAGAAASCLAAAAAIARAAAAGGGATGGGDEIQHVGAAELEQPRRDAVHVTRGREL